jgi:transcriptional regulator with PAS, ATPase and Fis domain
VGGTKEIQVDVRVVVATNCDLRRLVEEGRFLEDLFYRLNQLPVSVPPLRERRGDISALVEGFLKRANERAGRSARISGKAMKALANYPWPGNVRELKSCIDRAVVLHERRQAIESAEILPGKPGVVDEADDADVRFHDLSKKQKRRRVLDAIDQYGSALKAAEHLGVSPQTVYNYLKTD